MGAMADLRRQRREARGGVDLTADAFKYPDKRSPALRAIASSPVQNIASFLNRLLFPKTAVEMEFAPETQAYDEWVEKKTGTPAYRPGMSSPLSLGGSSPVLSPLIALLTSAKAAAEGRPGTPAARWGSAVKRGLKGEDEYFTSDVTAELFGPPENRTQGFLRGVTGGTADYLADPANLFDFFNLSEAGRVAKPMGTLAETIGEQAAKKQRSLISFAGKPVVYGAPVMKPISKATAAVRKSPLGELFVRGGTHAGLRKAILEHLHEGEVFKGEARVAARKTQEAIAEMVEKFGVPEDEVRRVVNEVLERGEVAGTPVTHARKKLAHLEMLDADRAPGAVPDAPVSAITPDPQTRLPELSTDPIGSGPGPRAPSPEKLPAREFGGSDFQRPVPRSDFDPTGAARPLADVPEQVAEAAAEPAKRHGFGDYGYKGRTIKRHGPGPGNIYGNLSEVDAQARKVADLERIPLAMKKEIVEKYGEEFYERGVRIAEDLAEGYSGELSAQQLRNLPVSELREMGYGGPRVFTDDGLTVIRKAGARIKRPFKRWSLTHASMRERLLTAGHSIDEVNTICADAQLGGVNRLLPELNELGEIVTVPKMLLDDPAALRMSYGMRVARVKATADLVEDIKRLPGAMHVDDIPLQNQAAELAGLVGVDLPAMTKGGENPLAGWLFDADLAKEIQRQLPEIIDPAFPSKFTQFFDAGTNWWKAWTLAPFPAYHTRNVVGNMVNAFHAGVRDPSVFEDAARIELATWEPDSKFGRWFQKNSNKSLGAVDHRALDAIGQKYGFQDFAELQLATETRGIMGFGWYGSEVAHGGREYMHISGLPGLGRLEGKRAGRWQPGKWMGRESIPVRSGMTVGTLLENNARLGVFLDTTRKNLGYGVPLAKSLDDAAWTVKKYLFDYSDAGLTKAERRVLKRIMPFYTWTRNNLPLQLEELVKHPHRFGALEKVRQGVETWAMPEGDPRYLPEWMTEAYSWATGSNSYTPMERWLPQAELGRFIPPSPEEWWKPLVEVGSMVHPLATQAAEQAFGKNLFTGRDLDSDYWRDVVGVKMHPRLANLLGGFRPLSEATWAMKPSEEMPVSDKLMRALVGRTYPYDEREARGRMLGRLDRELRDKTTRIRYEDDEGERARLMREYDELLAKYNALQ